MLLFLIFLFITVPLVELALLLLMGGMTKWWLPLVVVVVTGVVGAALARRQGWQTYRRIQRELGQGQMPGDALLDAVMIFVAGALLLTPGILTDAFGMSLLLPFCRRFYKNRLMNWLKSKFNVVDFSVGVPETIREDDVIDSYAVDRSDEDSDKAS